jgi:ABC-type transport system involved in multi-copper enzyme maturation permease subunit
MVTHIRYILLTARRDRLFLGILTAIAVAAYICSVLGSTAMLEPTQMTLAFTASVSRVMIMVGIIVFIGFHLQSAFENKEIELLLSRPISRTALVLAYWLGFALVALLLTLPAMAILYYLGPLNQTGFMVWSVSLVLEAWLVVAISLFAVLTLKSGVNAVLASLAIYALARLIGFFLALLKSGIALQDEWLRLTAHWIITIVSTLMPRLDFFAKSAWLIYGPKSYEDALLGVYQAAIFIPLLLAASIIDFKRKQF